MDKDTFWNLVNPWQESLFRFALSILKNHEDAQDAVQDVLEKIWFRRHHISKERNMFGYTMKIMKNHCIDILRKRKSLVELGGAEMKLSDANDFEDTDFVGFIKKRINQLSVQQRMIIELKDLQGFSYEEISSMMEIPISNLRVYLGRARKFVLNELKNEVK